MLDRLLAIVAPHSCSGCGNVGSLLCEYCKNDIVYEPFSRCLICLKPTVHGALCLICKQASGVSEAWVCGERQTALKTLLDRYKFDAAKAAGLICAELLDASVPHLPYDICVIPVPTASARVRYRGFDHTLLIAKRFAKRRGLSTKQVLRRTGSQVQHFKTRSERLRGAEAMFSVRGTVPPKALLVDDIYTTGATIAACTKKLRAAGVDQVYVAIIARQTLDEPRDLW